MPQVLVISDANVLIDMEAGGLETFGKDFETVRRQDPAFVWTVIYCDSASLSASVWLVLMAASSVSRCLRLIRSALQ